MEKQETRQWQKVAAAFCTVLMMVALVAFPMQAKAALNPTAGSKVEIASSTLSFSVAPGATFNINVHMDYVVDSTYNDLWIGLATNSSISDAWVRKVVAVSLDNVNVTSYFDITAPSQPGTYKLKAYAYNTFGAIGASAETATVVVTAPNVPAGKTTEQGTAYWMGVHYEMFYSTAKTVRANADVQDFNYVPHYIFDFLTANPSMTLRVQYKGDVYVLNEKNMQAHNVLPGLNYLFSSLNAMGL